MRRVRLALLSLALAIAVPIVLLLGQALRSAAVERRVRHEVVASRAFDEMERLLSSWLEREEARPFDDYRFYRERDGTRSRSPLSRLPDEPFVVGAFQMDPDGSVHTPLVPEDEGRARAAGDWPPQGVLERAARVRSLALLLSERPRRARPLAGPPSPSPGGLDEAESKSEVGLAKGLGYVTTPSGTGRTDAYAVLESLNRGAAQRAERRQKLMDVPRERDLASEAPRDAREEPLALRQAPSAAAPIEPPASEPPVERLVVDPMVGVALDPDGRFLALYRTVVSGVHGYRQGLVVDLDALGDYLESEVLDRGPLAGHARALFGGPGNPIADAPAAAYSFEHRFGEPFDALRLRLDLDPLAGAGDDRAVYALLALLVVLTAAGFLAVDRMTGVAVEYAERRNNFVAAVSHELKTPLTAIRMYGEMLRDGLVSDDAKRSEYYATITDESERLTRLINNVLEFSRLEKGGRELALVAGDPSPLVREAAQRLSPHAERAGFRLRVEIEDGLPPVLFDRDALLQVLFNLVDNSIKYAVSAARREIVLGVARRGSGVVVGVRDFGPGVSGDHARRVFEPFYRGENELTRRAKGTGLGLALVRDLARAMRARVDGDAPDGGGFRVQLTLSPA